MSDKLVRIRADKHAKIVKRAKKSGRTVPRELDVILDKALTEEQIDETR